MNKDKIFLGTIDKEPVYLYKHSWDCGWYWGMGYVGNSRWHFRIESLIIGNKEHDVNKIFSSTWLSQDDWWILRDLFIQAYALKAAAEVYQYGGHQTTKAGITDIIRDKDKAGPLNKDLEIVLNTIWNYLVTKQQETNNESN